MVKMPVERKRKGGILMMQRRRAYGAGILVAIIIGLSFMFVKITLLFTSPLDALAHRFTIAFIALSMYMLLKKEKELRKLPKRDLLKIGLLAIFYPILFFGFQIFGLIFTTSSVAGIVQATLPIFTLVFSSVILKEKSMFIQKLAISLSILGVIYMMLSSGIDGTSIMLLGMALILLSTISQSFYQVFARKLTKEYSLVTITYILTSSGFIIFNLLALYNHLLNGNFIEFIKPFGQWDYLFAILYLGILSTLVTSYLSTYALSILPAFQMSVFGNLTTVITIGAGIVFLNESFYYYHIIGTILVVLGVIGVNYFREKEDVKNELIEKIPLESKRSS